MMLKRNIERQFMVAVKTFPVVILTGARQTGKSTLCKTLLKNTHTYVSLEDTNLRREANDDPRTFLKNYPPPVIIDEIQYAPNLPSYIQGMVDEHRQRYGQFILTGSQNFLMMQKVSQSLAGRAALLTMFPCTVAEADTMRHPNRSEPRGVADWILRGGYPELRARPRLDRKLWCSSYIQLYLERDVRQILNIGDMRQFERFIQLAALRTGQMLNISDLARDATISVPTATRWLSILEASYQIFLLHPFHANLTKRLVKAPKLYFYDTAIACHLMGIGEQESLLKGPSFGALFETAVIMEQVKKLGSDDSWTTISYFRTQDGLEVDMVIEKNQTLSMIEIKTARTLTPAHAKALLQVEALLKRPVEKCILAPVPQHGLLTGDVVIRPWHKEIM